MYPFFEFKRSIDRFRQQETGSAAVQSAALFGAIALAVAGLAAPYLNSAVENYAQDRSLGIDRAITGSIETEKRYTIRRSVLEPNGSVIYR